MLNGVVVTSRLVLDAARAVRPYLPELVGAECAADIDARVAGLIDRASAGVDPTVDLLAALEADDRVRDWVAGYLWHGMPPDLAVDIERNLARPPGAGQPLDAAPERFECPIGHDYTRFRRLAAQDMGSCPTHDAALVRVDPDR